MAQMNLGWLDLNSPDGQTLLKTIWGVAREESPEVQTAIAWVIVNRSRLNRKNWGGSTISGVCKGDRQLFSCWYENGEVKGNEKMGPKEGQGNNLRAVLTEALQRGMDPTEGSTHYYHEANSIELDDSKFELTKKIGPYQFYKDRLQE